MSDAAQKLLEQIRALPEEDRRFICDRLWEPCFLNDPLAEFGHLSAREEYPQWSVFVPEGQAVAHMRRQPGSEPPIPNPPPSDLALELWERVAASPPDGQQFVADELYADLGYGYDFAAENPEFHAELMRRLDEVRDHPERLIDGDEVMAEARLRVARGEPRS